MRIGTIPPRGESCDDSSWRKDEWWWNSGVRAESSWPDSSWANDIKPFQGVWPTTIATSIPRPRRHLRHSRLLRPLRHRQGSTRWNSGVRVFLGKALVNQGIFAFGKPDFMGCFSEANSSDVNTVSIGLNENEYSQEKQIHLQNDLGNAREEFQGNSMNLTSDTGATIYARPAARSGPSTSPFFQRRQQRCIVSGSMQTNLDERFQIPTMQQRTAFLHRDHALFRRIFICPARGSSSSLRQASGGESSLRQL